MKPSTSRKRFFKASRHLGFAILFLGLLSGVLYAHLAPRVYRTAAIGLVSGGLIVSLASQITLHRNFEPSEEKDDPPLAVVSALLFGLTLCFYIAATVLHLLPGRSPYSHEILQISFSTATVDQLVIWGAYCSLIFFLTTIFAAVHNIHYRGGEPGTATMDAPDDQTEILGEEGES